MMDNKMLTAMALSGAMGGEDNPESGSSGNNEMIKILLGMSDDKEIVESVWEDGVFCGTAKDRSGDETIGVLEARLTPPVASDPNVRLRLKSNGVIFARPEHLRKVGAAFIRFSEDKELWRLHKELKEQEPAAEKEAEQKKLTRAITS